jgi:hypothetical protein
LPYTLSAKKCSKKEKNIIKTLITRHGNNPHGTARAIPILTGKMIFQKFELIEFGFRFEFFPILKDGDGRVMETLILVPEPAPFI